MARTKWLHTTEQGEWVLLPFRIRIDGVGKRRAESEAINWRLKGHMARVRPDGKRYLVATYAPRRRAAGGRELCHK